MNRIGTPCEPSSNCYDRTVKMPLYVRAGVASAIVNILDRRVELYASEEDLARPNGRMHAIGDTVDFCDVAIPVESLFARF
jgi:hypothetical protein